MNEFVQDIVQYLNSKYDFVCSMTSFHQVQQPESSYILIFPPVRARCLTHLFHGGLIYFKLLL
jgi:hypothetical protein